MNRHINDDYHAGYLDALRKVDTFGSDFKGDKALTDEERYILAQAVEVLEVEAEWYRKLGRES